ncbi:cytochrome P450 [Dactylosporangium matsuzakiense]|uniref:Cytochrome P450 n=1 Tax=Dactylosporangium matsuzakiense TaxID=53360 RepID=A0A9W6KFP0_9ACTN|nr:cytochrome P450 [Dactylosporangium matsuzakiense]GLK99194.1 cytochrome P450 [Dactylosporangium matsuzakiense]
MNGYPAARDAPHLMPQCYAHWREEGPLTRVELPDGRPAWLVTRHEDVRSVLRNPALSSDTSAPACPRFGSAVEVPPLNTTMIALDGPAHTRLRRMLGPEFSIAAVARLTPVVDRIVRESLDRLAAGPHSADAPADLVGGFTLPVASRLICHILGLGYEAHAIFERSTHVLSAGTSSAQQKLDAGATIVGLVGELVARRLRKPTDADLTGRLVASYVATGALSEDEAVHNLTLLLGAGHHTSANMTALSALSLMLDPALAQRFRDEPQLRANLVEELLRHHTIVQLGLSRVAGADIVVGDAVIHKGDGIVLSLQSANGDPRHFHDPGTLDPARAEARQHLAFGFGPHSCVGQNLARATIRSALSGLVHRLPGMRLAVPVEQLAFNDALDFHGLRALPIHW